MLENINFYITETLFVDYAVTPDFEKLDVERDCSNTRLISASWFENSQSLIVLYHCVFLKLLLPRYGSNWDKACKNPFLSDRLWYKVHFSSIKKEVNPSLITELRSKFYSRVKMYFVPKPV